MQDLRIFGKKGISRSLLVGALFLPCLLSCGKKGPLELSDAVRPMPALSSSVAAPPSIVAVPPGDLPNVVEDGKEEFSTGRIVVSPRKSVPPKVLENLKGFFASGTIYLLWSLPVDTSSLGGYRVCRMEEDGSKLCRIVFQPSFSDPDVNPGVLYRYRLTVLDDATQPLESPPAEIEVRATLKEKN